MLWTKKTSELPAADKTLPGRAESIPVAAKHFVTGNPLKPPFPANLESAVFAMGCFWGAERLLWETLGVFSTAVGYASGSTPNPAYEEVCSGRTGHAEVILVVFDPAAVAYADLLKIFWESHDPTQGMRQGYDAGTQYRSGIYVYGKAQRAAAEASASAFEAALKQRGYGPVTSEILDAPEFYFAEEPHQQYLAKNPAGYCGLGGTGVSCQLGAGAGGE